MKKLLWIGAVIHLTSSTVVNLPDQATWIAFGPFNVEASTTPIPSETIQCSTPTALILKSPTTPDCYMPTVTPNGTLGTRWVKCP